MDKIVTINYLSHNRLDYVNLMFYFLNKIKYENKNKIILNIIASVDNNWVEKITDIIDIETNIYIVKGSNNYLQKLNVAMSTNTKYSIKLDEDCFINNHIWDYIIENLNILDDEEILLLSPIMTNNIPSCDVFIEEAINDLTLKEKIYDNFINRAMPNGLWGVNYTPLNEYTINSNKWDSNNFYDGVRKLNTQTKGIHPIRICGESQVLINNYIIENIKILTDKNVYGLIEINAPYFTNSLFAIKTNIWEKIIRSRVDNYDEISLNNYKNNNNNKILFIENGFGVHLMYNTVYGNKNRWGIGLPNGDILEKEFYKNLEKQIII